jgi:hypothetical protein
VSGDPAADSTAAPHTPTAPHRDARHSPAASVMATGTEPEKDKNKKENKEKKQSNTMDTQIATVT